MAKASFILAHWHHLADDLRTSTLDFYAAVEEALRVREVPDIKTSRIDVREGGILSAKREYLRVTRGKLNFDICAAPFGRSFFFSTWLVEETPPLLMAALAIIFGGFFLFGTLVSQLGVLTGMTVFAAVLVLGIWALRSAIQSGALPWGEAIGAIPLVGRFLGALFRPTTYYTEDTRLMFLESVHRAVAETVTGIRSAQGLRALQPDELKPSLRNLLG